MYYIDITRTVNRGIGSIPTGIDRVELEYIKYFQRRSSVNFIFVDSGILWRLDNKWLNEKISGNDIALKSEFLENSYSINESIDGMYVNVSHHGVSLDNPILYYKGRRKYIYFLHDLIPIQNPESVRAGDYEIHHQRLLIMTSLAEMIICNSEYTKSCLVDWCLKNRIAIPQTIVAKLASSIPSDLSQYKFHEFSLKYYLYVSTLEPRKNHITLIHAWRRLVENHGIRSKLVFVGKRGWNNEDLFRYLDQNKVIKSYVKELSNVSDSFLKLLIENAHAVLFPSLNEGWGLPVTEAEQYGKKIICSKIPALIEASSGNAVFLDPLCVNEWVNEIIRTDDMPTERNISSQSWDWDSHFKLVNEIFEKF